MKVFTIFLFFIVCNSAFGEGEYCRLRSMVLRPTRDMLVPAGTDSRYGVFNTTIVRNEVKTRLAHNISNRLAVRLKGGQSVQLLMEKTEFRVTQYSQEVHGVPGYMLKTGNREYLFYCGECELQGRYPNVDDLLSLVHEDGTPFFEVLCPEPNAEIVPASLIRKQAKEAAEAVSL